MSQINKRIRSVSGDNSPDIRLNKFLATAGVCSRRKADEMIAAGRVRVNGRVVNELGYKVNPVSDSVFFNDKQVVILDAPVYILLNKPNDSITTSNDERGRTTVMDYVKVKQRVFPIGRLDRSTTGVLLLTNDGEFANKLMHPKFEVKKAYKVTLDKPLEDDDRKALEKGIRLSDGKTKPAEIHMFPDGKNKVLGIVIHEGKNRQVHRMFEARGYFVRKLDRVAYADITYQGLSRGQWRYLTKKELTRLRSLFTASDDSDS